MDQRRLALSQVHERDGYSADGALRDAVTFGVEVPEASVGKTGFVTLSLFAIAAGAAIRLFLVLRSNFPLGDGGLFYVMVRNLAAHHYLLPLYTTYSGHRIPFAYPPLGFYLVGALHDILSIPWLQLFRFFPLAVSILSLGAFALLARGLLSSQLGAGAATFAFALLPDSFHTELMGGGITRGPGMLFSILTLQQAALLYQRRDPRYLLPATIFGALTVLSHPSWTLFTVYSVVVLFLALGRNRQGLLYSEALAAGTLVIIAPWWLMTALRLGIRPFLATMTGSSQVTPWYLGLAELFTLHLIQEPWFPVITALALLGFVVCLVDRRWLLPLWFLVTLLVASRAYAEPPTVLMACLAGVGVEGALLPLLRGRVQAPFDLTSRRNRRLIAVVLGFLLLRMILGTTLSEAASDTALSPGQRAAMAWVAAHTPAASRFLVLTGVYWSLDDNSEWFPALAHRPSVATVQGNEWIPGAFARRVDQSKQLQSCTGREASCIQRWTERTGRIAGYVYIAKGTGTGGGNCCVLLRHSLDRDPRYVRIYDGPGAAVYRITGRGRPKGGAAG